MIERQAYAVIRAEESVLATNKVLRNTYLLLALTLLCTAGTAALSMRLALPYPGMLITLVGYFAMVCWLMNVARTPGPAA